MNEKTAPGIARGLTCGPHCVLSQWLNIDLSVLILLIKICL